MASIAPASKKPNKIRDSNFVSHMHAYRIDGRTKVSDHLHQAVFDGLDIVL